MNSTAKSVLVVEGGPSVYRAPANEDPHGTRGIAMALPAKIREQLAHPGTTPRMFALLATQLPLQVGIQITLQGGVRLSDLTWIGLGMLAVAYGSRILSARFQVTDRELVVRSGSKHEAFPWAKVESFQTNRMGARATIRAGDRLENRRAVRNVFAQTPSVEAALSIPTEVLELAGGARRSVATVFGSIGVVISTIALGVAVAMHASTGAWAALGAAVLCYAFLTLGIAYRNHLTAKPDGLHLPHRVVPWLAIEEAAPKDASGSTELRIRVVGEEERTVFCGDAEGAAAAIIERRDVARRMRTERET